MAFNISRFKTTLDKYGGPARANLFEVTISKGSEPNSKMNSQDLTFFCSNIIFPGIAIETQQMTAVAQRPRLFPTTIQNQPINAGFMVDSDHEVLKFFHNWTQRVLNYSSKDGPYAAIGDDNNLQLPYELGYKEDYVCTISIKSHSTESVGSKYYETILYNAFPIAVGDMTLAWSDTDQFLQLPVTFSYDKIYYSGDRTGKQTQSNGRGLLETLGDLAGFADVVKQTISGGKPKSIQDAVNRLNRVRNSYDKLTDFF